MVIVYVNAVFDSGKAYGYCSFQKYYHDLLRNKVARFNFMFLDYGVHKL